MSHHLITTSADGIHDLGSLVCVSDLEFLLQENGRLLIGRLDDTHDEELIGRRRRRMKQ